MSEEFTEMKWHDATLEDCLDALIDYRGKSPQKSATGIPVLSAKVVKTEGLVRPIEQTISHAYYPKWMTRGLPKSGDVVFTTEGPLGEVIQLDAETAKYALGQRIVCLRGKRGKLDNTFLRYLLTAPHQRVIIEGRATGTTVLGISQKALRQMPVRLPDFDFQVMVGQTLRTLDDKIELNRQMNQTLEAMARAVFLDWFVDFGPTRRKAAGITDPAAILGGLILNPTQSAPLATLFPDSFGANELPLGWNCSTVGAELETLLGGTPSRVRKDYWGGHIPWINSGKANEFRVIEASEYITQIGYDNSATKLMPKRTTLIAITGATLGQVSLNETEVCANQSIVGVVGNDKLSSEYVYCWVKENIDKLVAAQTGGAQQHINKNNVNDLAVIVPHDRIMNAWSGFSIPLFDLIAQNCFENQTLAATRDLLLPKLMSGELRLLQGGDEL